MPPLQVSGLILFSASVLGLLYVAAGYPLALSLLARRPKPVSPKPFLPSVTVLLPVHNGAPWIRQKLNSLLALDYPGTLMRILVISDGSEDETDEIARSYTARGVELLRVPRGGKALALNAGIERAGGDLLFFTDVRQTIESGSLRHLASFFADPAVGAVSGELVIRDGRTQGEANVGLYWKYEKWIRRRLSQIDSVDGATGCIYAMRRSLAVPMPAQTICDDIYLPAAALLRGYRLLWTDGAKAFDYPTALDVEFRRKVRTQAGVYQLFLFLPELLNPWRCRIWIHFLSHRLGRLMLPFFLGGALIGSLALPQMARIPALGAQALFYLLALADPYIAEKGAVKRATSMARTMVMLAAAAFRAAGILFHPHREFWKVTRVGAAEAALADAKGHSAAAGTGTGG